MRVWPGASRIGTEMAVPRMSAGCAACMARSVESSVASTKPSPRRLSEVRKVRMFSPESGDQCGAVKELNDCLRSSVGRVPSVSMIQILSEPPERLLWNAITVPSGDHAGDWPCGELTVTRVCEPPDEVILSLSQL